MRPFVRPVLTWSVSQTQISKALLTAYLLFSQSLKYILRLVSSAFSILFLNLSLMLMYFFMFDVLVKI